MSGSRPMATQPPWHLWGNTQIIKTRVQLGGLGLLPQPNMNTLCRVDYGRPETWHWLFQARLISGPNSTPGTTMNVLVNFNVALGIGRANARIYSDAGTQNRPLEGLAFLLGPAVPTFPANAHLYSTVGQSSRQFSEAVVAGQQVEQIVAETIVCEVNVTSSAEAANIAALGQEVVVEVTGLFAPKNHVRPDWYQNDVDPTQQFAGAETGAR